MHLACNQTVFCQFLYSNSIPMALHLQAVRAMRFEPGAHKHALESEEARKERLAAEAQLAKEIEEEEEDEGM